MSTVTKLTMANEAGTNLVSFEWVAGADTVMLKFKDDDYIELDAIECDELFNIAGEVYRAMTGNEPASYFAETPDHD